MVIFDGRTILTASHVVGRAKKILVRTQNGRIMEAVLKGRDRATDLAVLQIERQLPALQFGGDARLGARVCALGNAFGLDLSVTCGIVSGVHKAGLGFNPIEDFVQTDAAVNPGASGGALVNENGILVGLLSAIFTKRSDSNIGVNFAVAAPLAKLIAEDLLATGRVERRGAGMQLRPFPAKGETGRLSAQVRFVRPNSPAALAGIEPGDRIVRIGSRRIRKPADAISAFARLRKDEEIDIRVRPQHGGRAKTIKLTIQ